MDCLQKPEFWVSIATLIVTVYIPTQIMKFQRYTNLIATYMSLDFAHALQSVIAFFCNDCGHDVERIPAEYKKRFDSDMKRVMRSDNNEDITGDITKVLHYQRRFLNNYFLELEMCRQSSMVLRRVLRKDWTANEADIVKILIYMNEAVKNDPDMFKDLSDIEYERMPKVKGMGEYLANFYNVMRKERRWMQKR